MQMNRCTKCMEELGQGVLVCPHCGYHQGSGQPSNALQENTILHGRYLVGKVIGQGGFGITYVGYDLTLEMKVALKEYFPSGFAARTGSYSSQVQWDFGDNERVQWSEGIDRFMKEARKMARLDSVPSIVRVRDAFRENQTAYIVMDFVEGETLKSYLLRHGVLSYEKCVGLLSPILESLAVIHDNGFIHRDISPDNIMLQPDGAARLLDMGAAMDIRTSDGRVSMAVVKRNFSAPEQYVESEVLGRWTDVYAMTATIYYCLTGKVVPEAMEREFKKEPLAFPSGADIPQQGIQAITAGLEMKAEKRIQNMRELKRRLTAPSPAQKENGNHEERTNVASEPANPAGKGGEEKKKNGESLSGLKKLGKLIQKLIFRVLCGAGAFFLILMMIGFWASRREEKASVQEEDIGAEVDRGRTDTEEETEADKKRSGEKDSSEEKEEETESPASEAAEDKKYEYDDFGIFSLNEDGTYMLVACVKENAACIQVPSEYNGSVVTAIGDFAFIDCTKIQQVRIPDTVQVLGMGVFDDCESLRVVFLPSSIQEIRGPLVDELDEAKDTRPKRIYFYSGSEEDIKKQSWCENWQGEGDWVFCSECSAADDPDYRGWIGEKDGSWRFYEDGFVKFGWQKINGRSYWFDEKAAAVVGWGSDGQGGRYYFDETECYMVTGWREIDGNWYYFDLTDGHLFQDTTTPDGYEVDGDGVCTSR